MTPYRLEDLENQILTCEQLRYLVENEVYTSVYFQVTIDGRYFLHGLSDYDALYVLKRILTHLEHNPRLSTGVFYDSFNDLTINYSPALPSSLIKQSSYSYGN